MLLQVLLTLPEAENLVKKHHFKITEGDETSDYKSKTISQEDLNYMYSVANGSPRHIVSYLFSGYNLSLVRQEVSEQFEEVVAAVARYWCCWTDKPVYT